MMARCIRITLWLCWIAFSIGSLTALFLWGLDQIQARGGPEAWAWLGLPILALAFHLVQTWWPQWKQAKLNHYLQEKTSHASHAPYVLLGTWLSQWAGASVGREGTALVMGSSQASFWWKRMEVPGLRYQEVLQMGMAAGFAAVFGTPLTGALFALELKKSWVPEPLQVLRFLSVGFLAHWTVIHVYGLQHLIYPPIFAPVFSWGFVAKLIVIGLFLALFARCYKASESFISRWTEQWPIQGILKPLLSGLMLALWFQIPAFQSSSGLGAEFLLRPFENADPQVLASFAGTKAISTSLSLGWGYIGGEATPLFLMGAHGAAAWAPILNLPSGLLAALGFLGLYHGLSKTPLAGTLMGLELFGLHAWWCYLLVCILSTIFTGRTRLFTAA